MRRRNLLGLGLAGAALAACESPAEPAATRPTAAGSPPAGRRVLVAYFSRAGENYWNGGRRDLEVGNTEVVAGFVRDALGCDTYRIEAADPYPDGYDETVARNTREQDADARPAIAGALPDLSGYDAVILGSPIWSVRPPMIMTTFTDAADLTGTTVFPLVTYAVSGLGRTAEIYAAATTLGEALAVRGEEAADARPAVEDWLRRTALATRQ